MLTWSCRRVSTEIRIRLGAAGQDSEMAAAANKTAALRIFISDLIYHNLRGLPIQ